MRALLDRVARLYPCAVISGRAHRDLRRRVAGIPVVALVGSHGAEGDAPPPPKGLRSRVRTWAMRLRRRLRVHRGVALECKPLGVAVHYRRAPDEDAARRAIREAAALIGEEGVRVLVGKKVVEFLPSACPDKGHALAALRRRFKPSFTLYVGDDVTDEEAFTCRGPGRLLSVRVGPAPATAARFRLDGPEDVEALLEELAKGAHGGAADRATG
jgi:trehalose 6-phosphate phosphatase